MIDSKFPLEAYEALRRAEGRATQAAERLKLPRKTFYDKLARYGIRAEDFRSE